MIDITKQLKSQIEIAKLAEDGMLVYLYLGKINKETRHGAVGFLSLSGFSIMSHLSGKVRAYPSIGEWFKVEMDEETYAGWDFEE